MKQFNLDDIIKYHCTSKKTLVKIYKMLEKQNQENEKLMKKILPLIEKSEIKYF